MTVGVGELESVIQLCRYEVMNGSLELSWSMASKTPAPRELYEHWPHQVIRGNPIHESVRLAVWRLILEMDASEAYRSAKSLERVTGVPRSTIGDILSGKSWPNVLTLAALEYGSVRSCGLTLTSVKRRPEKQKFKRFMLQILTRKKTMNS